MTICIGIDEAGYGPLLGPLAITAVAVEADGHDAATAAMAAAALGVRDSKRLHRPGDLAPLESVALPGLRWLTGLPLTSAAEVFASLGESEADRADCPWLSGAAGLALPTACVHLPTWRLDRPRPLTVAGRLVQPGALNAAAAQGRNKAAVELEIIADALRPHLTVGGEVDVVCDRLGGRRYYGEFLAGIVRGGRVVDADEAVPALSAYRLDLPAGRARVAFRVGGEAASGLVALASCLAKYARELQMILFNRWWGAAVPGLAPTAGYPEDAGRWLKGIGETLRKKHGPLLVRGYVPARAAVHGGAPTT